MKDEKIKIDKFDGANFGFYKLQIEDYIFGKYLYESLIGDKVKNKMVVE